MYYSAKHNIHTQIDYILLSDALQHRSLNSSIGIKTWMDHARVEFSLSHDNIHNFDYSWSLNSSILKKFNWKLKKEIEDFVKSNEDSGVSQQCCWDTLKAILRGKFISLSFSLKNKKSNEKKR